MLHVPLLVEISLKARTTGSGSMSWIARSVLPIRRNELIGDVRDMITGFWKNNRMEPSGSGRNENGGVPARRAWIPLKDRETVLMTHEVAVGCVNASKPVRFGLPKFDHGRTMARV